MDWERYHRDHPDLRDLDERLLPQHYELFGRIEGRKLYPLATGDVDWQNYIDRYFDLHPLIRTHEEARNHYIQCGRDEGRVIRPLQTAIVIPFGFKCDMAFWLIQQTYSNCSLPFDWVLSEPSCTLAALRNQFQNFLRTEDIPEHYHDHVGRVLITNQYGIGFPHLFNVNIPIGPQIPDAIAKTKRRCERLLNILNGQQPVIFVMYQPDADKSFTEPDIKALADQLTNDYPRLQFRIVAVTHSTEFPTRMTGSHYVLARGNYHVPQSLWIVKHQELNDLLQKLLQQAAEELGAHLPQGHKRAIWKDESRTI